MIAGGKIWHLHPLYPTWHLALLLPYPTPISARTISLLCSTLCFFKTDGCLKSSPAYVFASQNCLLPQILPRFDLRFPKIASDALDLTSATELSRQYYRRKLALGLTALLLLGVCVAI